MLFFQAFLLLGYLYSDWLAGRLAFKVQVALHTCLDDARLALDRESDQQFDVLVLDAFSGDSIPKHLLTREAFTTYFRHLKPDGLLAAHVSNQYLDIGSVVERMGIELGKQAVVINSPGGNESRSLPATWILRTGSRGLLENPRLKALAGSAALKPAADVWTDDYSNLFRVLK